MYSQHKICYMFNKFFSSFIKELKTMDDSLRAKIKKNFKVIDKSSEEYYVQFWTHVKDNMNVLTTADYETISSSSTLQSAEIIKDITLNDILSVVQGANREVFWNYFNILLVFAYLLTEAKAEEETVAHEEAKQEETDAEQSDKPASEQSTDGDEDEAEEPKPVVSAAYTLFVKVVSILSQIQKGQDVSSDLDDIVDDDVKALLNKIQTVSVPADDIKIDEQAIPSPDDFLKNLGNSKIANLAKEISQEIDTTNIKVDKPEDIAKLLDFSGSNNLLGDIFTKVSSKLSEKISSGDLKQDDLMGEAMSLMGMLQGGGNGGIADLLKTFGGGGMGGLGGLADLMSNPMVSEMMKMAKKGKVQPKSHMRKQSSTRDRLRKKLESKKAAGGSNE